MMYEEGQDETPKLKGYHVLLVLVLFFGAMIVANSIMVYSAVTTFRGQEMQKAYVKGLNFNEQLAVRKEQIERGWQARVLVDTQGTERVLALDLIDKESAPVGGMNWDAVLRRPATAQEDTPVIFQEIGPGLYRAELPALGKGAWDLQASGIDYNGQIFQLTARVMLD